MADAFTAARKRQLARLGGARPPAPRATIALAKSQAYQDAADAPATLRAYATDLTNYKAWCDRHGFVAMPATPEPTWRRVARPKLRIFRRTVLAPHRSAEGEDGREENRPLRTSPALAHAGR